MNEPLALFNQPHMGFFATIIIGGLAGWFAGMFTGMRHGILTNILIGIVGYYLAAYVVTALNISVHGSPMRLMVATAGAIAVVYVWQALNSRSAR